MNSFFTNAWRWGLLVLVLPLAMAGATRADEVTDWHEHMLAALGPSPIVGSRDAALVSAAVFDAVNGIERRYAPIRVLPAAPRGASKREGEPQREFDANVTTTFAPELSIELICQEPLKVAPDRISIQWPVKYAGADVVRLSLTMLPVTSITDPPPKEGSSVRWPDSPPLSAIRLPNICVVVCRARKVPAPPIR